MPTIVGADEAYHCRNSNIRRHGGMTEALLCSAGLRAIVHVVEEEVSLIPLDSRNAAKVSN